MTGWVPLLSGFLGALAALLVAWVGLRRFTAESRKDKAEVLAKQEEIADRTAAQNDQQSKMLADIKIQVDGKLTALLEAMRVKAELEVKLARLSSFRDGAEDQRIATHNKIAELEGTINGLQMRQAGLEAGLAHKARLEPGPEGV